MPALFKAAGILPCENDQAKPDRFSRLARSTLLSKILTVHRLSGTVLDRGPGFVAGGVLELIAQPALYLEALAGVFARTFQDYRTSDFVSTLESQRIKPVNTRELQIISSAISIVCGEQISTAKASRNAKFQTSTSSNRSSR